jgi:hypothetical protein
VSVGRLPHSREPANPPDILSADIPAGGKTSARAIARMYASVLGEVDGVRLITPERLDTATEIIQIVQNALARG